MSRHPQTAARIVAVIDGAGGNARGFQDRRVDHDDVRHCGEGRNPREDLAADARAARFDLEELAKSDQWFIPKLLNFVLKECSCPAYLSRHPRSIGMACLISS